VHRVIFLLRAYNPVEPLIEVLDHEQSMQVSEGQLVERGEGLTQWFVLRPGVVEAHYVFNDAYVREHPEALDESHLRMLHALITFKLFDEEDILIPPKQLAGVVRWPAMGEKRKPLVLSET
jgi:hypothetical protein